MPLIYTTEYILCTTFKNKNNINQNVKKTIFSK